jgi:nucleoid-associated protein YgaU
MRTTVDRPGERVDAGGAPRPIPRALAAVAALVGIVAVVPAGLVALGSALPVDPAVLGPGLLTRADDGALLVLGLLALAWAAWSVVTLSIVLEVVAAVRGLPTPRVRGLHGPQRIAGALVAAAAVLVSPGGPSPAVAVPVPVLAQVLDRAPVPQLPGESSAAPSPGPAHADAEAAPEAELPTLTTERHDTLWMLAEAHLGRGERFTEIVELNRGVAQPDGRSLGDDGRLYPGWLLRLPADAVVDVARPERHRVAPGDTLWDIAGEALGDPTRYPEVFAANAGDLQPDGRRLTDPDLIVPGWVLEVPGTGTEPGGAEPGGAEPGGTEPGGAEVMPDGAGRTMVPPEPVDAVPSAGVASGPEKTVAVPDPGRQ